MHLALRLPQRGHNVDPRSNVDPLLGFIGGKKVIYKDNGKENGVYHVGFRV